ncbi:MAG: septum formation protein Maf [Candidatus Eisenbacteria bacterium]|uniref:dTTP/UTP pyrophosphatase n=1 Tax=Eiseniibacteriota bacterium TaxID=2212470 RepID=A0A948RT44_UNCEI|nr:septum formation protein Maf [Candidatus Eisenbacteria bacterium]MBU2690528.1 septum formation protein Maf [Candidatus Eisenbacteria bacterium]
MIGKSPPAEEILRRGSEDLILASRSARRKMLLEMLGVSFRIVPPPEDPPAAERVSDPERYAVTQALQKCRAVALNQPEDSPVVILGADTIVILGEDVLEKPKDEDEAFRYLKQLAGREHTVITGLALHRRGDGREVTGYEASRVRMAALDDGTIRRYIRTGEPMDKAGAYGIQGIGALIIEAVSGCYFNVVGLPLARLRRLFEELET